MDFGTMLESALLLVEVAKPKTEEEKRQHLSRCQKNFIDEFGQLPSEETISRIKELIKGAEKNSAAAKRASDILLHGRYLEGDKTVWVAPRYQRRGGEFVERTREGVRDEKPVLMSHGLWGPAHIYKWTKPEIMAAMSVEAIPGIVRRKVATERDIRADRVDDLEQQAYMMLTGGYWEERRSGGEKLWKEGLIDSDACRTPFYAYVDEILPKSLRKWGRTARKIVGKVSEVAKKICPDCGAEYIRKVVRDPTTKADVIKFEKPAPVKRADGTVCRHESEPVSTRRFTPGAGAESLDMPIRTAEGELERHEVVPGKEEEPSKKLEREEILRKILKDRVGGTNLEIDAATMILNRIPSDEIALTLTGGKSITKCKKCKAQYERQKVGGKPVFVPKCACTPAEMEVEWVRPVRVGNQIEFAPGDLSKAEFARTDFGQVKILSTRGDPWESGESYVEIDEGDRRGEKVWVKNSELKPIQFLSAEGLPLDVSSKMSRLKESLTKKAHLYRNYIETIREKYANVPVEKLPIDIRKEVQLVDDAFRMVGIPIYRRMTRSPAAQKDSDHNSVVDARWGWKPGAFVGKVIRFIDGENEGEVRKITDNSISTIAWEKPLKYAVKQYDRFEITAPDETGYDLATDSRYRIPAVKEVARKYAWIPQEQKVEIMKAETPEELNKRLARVGASTALSIYELHPRMLPRPWDDLQKKKVRTALESIIDILNDIDTSDAVDKMRKKVADYAKFVKEVLEKRRSEGDARPDNEILDSIGIVEPDVFFDEWPRHFPVRLSPYAESLARLANLLESITSDRLESKLAFIL